MGKPIVSVLSSVVCLAACFLVDTAAAQPPVVTATKWVSTGRDHKQLLRKINGRWWTEDDRLVSPPSQSGAAGFWTIDSKVGVCVFYHHRPFDIRRSGLVHLWMTPAEVEPLLGPPNRRFPMRSEKGGMWYYFAPVGTALQLWFMERDELGQAEYLLPGGGKQPVPSFARELNGESIFKLSARRATQLAQQERASHSPSQRARSPQSIPIPPATGPDKPVRKSIVSKSALDSIQLGTTRDVVLTQLGEPTYRSSISGDEGLKETFTYHLDESTPATIRLLNGMVAQVR